MKKITSLTTPPSVLGIFEQPQHRTDIDFSAKWTLALDDVQDPGNVGTIIRLCDWFGIETLLCSLHTADCYAPKVVQATMGAIARIRVLYVDLAPFLAQTGVLVYGTFLEGSNIYLADLQQGGVVVLGSEGQGISKEVAAVSHAKLHIPSFSSDRSSESLNVASAAAVVCSEIGRRNNAL
jgi:TrmH family RNA methyltransferase